VPEPTYSPRLRTAIVFCGAGTAGAYQAGALRALTEAGIKVDVMAAHGAGVVTALCGAIDGGARLWSPDGPWQSPRLRAAYRWREALRLGGFGLVMAALLIVAPLLIMVFAAAVYAVALLAALINLPDVSARLVDLFRWSISILFSPPILPTMMPRSVVLAMLVVFGILVTAAVKAMRQERSRRRWQGSFWWHLVGSPLEPDEPENLLVDALWTLVRGASTEPRPPSAEIGRRYVDLLTDNFGQPGFRGLLIAVHDLDARRDLVGTVMPPEMHVPMAARRKGPGPREAELFDLTGIQKELVVDFLKGAVRLPVASAPHVMQFPAESFWRGESHRLCDRPELPARLIEEMATAGIEQVVLISPAPPAAVPHGMRSKPLDLRSRMGELLRSIETAALHDAWNAALTRFSGVFVIRPDHNPIGPFEFSGAYDEASDRHRSLQELLQQGYDDAYRQFIEPVAAVGERVEAI
jgi:hypothetical protein